MLYSKTTGGFYSKEIHGDNIPPDSVALTAEEHALLLSGEASGMLISHNENGFPVLSERPAPTAEMLSLTARERRNNLLAETDYMLIQDYPAPAERFDAVKAYRQALRDITAQPGFPSAIDWPIF